MGYNLDEALMLFAIYSMAGWFINVCMYNLIEGKYDHRGICKGPYGAAFGVGAMALLACTRYAPKNLMSIFGIGVAVGITVQTFTAIVIRLLCGKWIVLYKWYYIILFGIANVLLCYQINPLVYAIVAWLPSWVRLAGLLAFWLSFVPDMIDGIARLRKFKRKIMA